MSFYIYETQYKSGEGDIKMAEKVKITQEQANALEWLQKIEGEEMGWEQGRLIKSHAKDINDWHDEAIALRGMPLLTLVDALRIGYEIEPEYKVGDWIAFTEGHEKSGRVYQVAQLTENLANIDYADGFASWWPINEFRHATPEEIRTEKERRLWKTIGREVGEFKDKDKGIHACGVSIHDKSSIKKCYEGGTLKGFYPAESFISFEEGDSE